MKRELLGTKICPRATLPTTNLTWTVLGVDQAGYILRCQLKLLRLDYLVEIK